MADWLKHTVDIKINAPMDIIWSLWSDIEQMPRWMNWIKSVKILEEDPKLSRWTLASNNLEFSWLSRNLKMIQYQIIQWESIDGLPNKGAVRFYDRHDHIVVKLTISYAIPGVIGKIMDNLFLGRFVESTLKSDLEKFKTYVENQN